MKRLVSTEIEGSSCVSEGQVVSDTLRTIFGTIRRADGVSLPNLDLVFNRIYRGTQAQGLSLVPNTTVIVTTNGTGDFSLNLMAGQYAVSYTVDGEGTVFRICVPDQEGPFDITTLIDTVPVKISNLDAFGEITNQTKAWASAPEDQEVIDGLYSARHYHLKTAADALATASDRVATGEDVIAAQGSADAAALSESNASDSEIAAAASALAASNSEDAALESEVNAAASESSAAAYARRHFGNVAEMLASPLTYTAGSSDTVTEGDYIVVQDGMFGYSVLASGASSADLNTAGGVKLSVLRNGPRYDITQMGPAANGSTDDRAKIQTLIDKAAAEGGGEIEFPHEAYAIAAPLEYKTGVTLVGVGRQTSKIIATAAMENMIQPVDLDEDNLLGMSAIFRFGLRNIWLAGNNLANYCVRMVSTRDSNFSQLYTDGALLGAGSVECRNYYNHWYSCTDNGPSRGWVFFEDAGQDSTGSNENHFWSCRKNGGTDGWYIQTVSSWINSIKLHDCVVEGHSGRAVYAVAGAGFAIQNLVIENMRVDSVVSGARTITFQGAKADIVRPTIQNLYSQGAMAPDAANGVTDPQLIGWPFRLIYDLTVDFTSIAANSPGRHEFALFQPGGPPGDQLTPKRWRLTVNPVGGGALSTGIVSWSVRVKSNNVGEIVLHTYEDASIDLVSQDFIVVADRIAL